MIEKQFQYIGYFNRPLSTAIFLVIVLVLFTLYFLTVWMTRKNKLSRKSIWTIILVVSGILFLSYNAFSYDLFNYIFDARIVTHYQQNPYFHKALDYPGDPMLSFMHWTHRTFPYGPVWLILTVPLSFIGFGYFLLTLYIFKLFIISCYIGSVYLIEKISKKLKISSPLFIVAVFALNPLVIIESLVSSHNDIVTVFFALLSFFYLFEKKHFKSAAGFVLSFFLKFANAFLLPAYVYWFVAKKRFSPQTFFYISSICMIIPVVLASYRTNFQPWYLLFILPFAVFTAEKKYVFFPISIMSFAALMQYVPYLYLGNWNDPVAQILFWINVVAIGLSFVISIPFVVKRR